MTTIIALSGRKQSGKSTAAEYIQLLINNTTNLSSKIYSFADPLKQDICIGILGLSYEQCYGTDEDKNTLTSLRWQDMPEYDVTWTLKEGYDPSGFMTARQVMEFVGTSIFRRMKNNVWSAATIKKILTENLDVALIADCRFPNEADIVQQNNGLVIRLTMDPYNSSSNSESALDKCYYDWSKFDLILHNSSMSIDEKNCKLHSYLKDKGILTL